MDKLLEAARSTMDPKERLADYTKIYQIVQDDVPMIPLYQIGVIYAVNSHLQWFPTANESLFVMDMKWKD